jgi:hypothetical protein
VSLASHHHSTHLTNNPRSISSTRNINNPRVNTILARNTERNNKDL